MLKNLWSLLWGNSRNRENQKSLTNHSLEILPRILNPNFLADIYRRTTEEKGFGEGRAGLKTHPDCLVVMRLWTKTHLFQPQFPQLFTENKNQPLVHRIVLRSQLNDSEAIKHLKRTGTKLVPIIIHHMVNWYGTFNKILRTTNYFIYQ